MLTAVVLGLKPLEEARLPVSHGGLAYAAALDLLLRLDPALSLSLHGDAPRKPITVSPLSGPAGKEGGELLLSPESVYSWRITGLTQEVSERLLDLSPALGGVRFREVVLDLVHATCSREEDPEAGQDSYLSLLAKWKEGPQPRTVKFRFLTPTTFRIGRFEQPFPLPRLVFGSLLRTWNSFSPVPLQFTPEEIEAVVVLGSWKGETRRVELGGARTVGFVGSFSYRVLASEPELPRMVGMLAEFAFYAGVGWQTTHGLGQVRLT